LICLQQLSPTKGRSIKHSQYKWVFNRNILYVRQQRSINFIVLNPSMKLKGSHESSGRSLSRFDPSELSNFGGSTRLASDDWDLCCRYKSSAYTFHIRIREWWFGLFVNSYLTSCLGMTAKECEGSTVLMYRIGIVVWNWFNRCCPRRRLVLVQLCVVCLFDSFISFWKIKKNNYRAHVKCVVVGSSGILRPQIKKDSLNALPRQNLLQINRWSYPNHFRSGYEWETAFSSL